MLLYRAVCSYGLSDAELISSHTTAGIVSAVLVPFSRRVWAIEASDLHACALPPGSYIFRVCAVTVLFGCVWLLASGICDSTAIS